MSALLASDAPHPAAPFLRQQARNMQLDGYVRIGLWCWGNANSHGHARAWPGQLQETLKFSTVNEVSRAIHHARNRGLIDQCSTSACLVMPGCALVGCEARHRDGL